jgi:hypothetical protein
MAIKRLSKDKLEQLHNLRLEWLGLHNRLLKQSTHSDLWFALLRERNAVYSLIMNLTGLTMKRVDELIFNKVPAETFWLADGTIRKNHPHE